MNWARHLLPMVLVEASLMSPDAGSVRSGAWSPLPPDLPAEWDDVPPGVIRAVPMAHLARFDNTAAVMVALDGTVCLTSCLVCGSPVNTVEAGRTEDPSLPPGEFPIIRPQRQRDWMQLRPCGHTLDDADDEGLLMTDLVRLEETVGVPAWLNRWLERYGRALTDPGVEPALGIIDSPVFDP